MERRSFLGAALTASLALTFTRTTPAALAAGETGPDSVGPDSAGPDPAGPVRGPGLPNWPLFEWEQPGALLDPGGGVLRPPPLAVNGDGTAYADAAKYLRIPPIWVSSLRDHAREVLGTPADLLRGSPPPTGRPFDQVRVRTAVGDFLTMRLASWQDGDPEHAYPPEIRELYQHAMGIRRHVLNSGAPWRPVGVLLGVATLDHRPSRFWSWPRALPTPDDVAYQEFRLPDGPAGLRPPDGGRWPFYRLRPDHFVAASWRSLLPYEIT